MNSFSNEALTEHSQKWDQSISRMNTLYSRKGDIRSEFTRDYTRILHSTAYRRLKHKTQVFYATENDHICTRIEHVSHVASVSYSISQTLGLNTELTNAIAIGHDLGHPPFGHQGESVLTKLASENNLSSFWHEKNSLFFVDKIETLPSPTGSLFNLNLTYAVRDGIISHCGEIDDVGLKPRVAAINLDAFNQPNQYSPFSWEGCVVKIADKIAYLGRDIEDAILLDILSYSDIKELKSIYKIQLQKTGKLREMNNTVLINDFINDLCKNSSVEEGLSFSPDMFEALKAIKRFSSLKIYSNKRLSPFKSYVELIINTIYNFLSDSYNKILNYTYARYQSKFPFLYNSFTEWLNKYSNISDVYRHNNKCAFQSSFNVFSFSGYSEAIIYFISGMTDNFAVKCFEEIIRF